MTPERRLLALLALAAGVAGCSLILDFNEAGLPCNSAGECLEGYVCDRNDACMPEGSDTTLCRPDPDCGHFAKCVKAQCKPVCAKKDPKKADVTYVRGCGAGKYCDDGTGQCETVQAASRGYGLRCDTNQDCSGSSPENAKCLRPYGKGSGFCTATCTSDGDCGGGRAGKCVEFRGARGSVKLCAAPAFLPCNKESDCTESEMSCGSFAFEKPSTVAIMACRERIQDGAAIGQKCTSGVPCANGLCVPLPGSTIDGVCTTPCLTKGDCEETADPAHKADAGCMEITLDPAAFSTSGVSRLPRVRPTMCVNGDKTLSFACSSATSCGVDAPQCLSFNPNDPSTKLCTAACGEDAEDKCPQGMTATPNADGPAGCYCK